MRVGSSKASVTFLCIHLCVCWALSHGQTCYSTEPEGTCSSSDSCRAEHGSEDNECSQFDQVVPTELPGNIQRCSVNGPFFLVEPVCMSSSSPVNSSYILDNPISSVNASFYSVNWHSFAVDVSWEHHVNHAEGYQLKITYSNNYNILDCYCIYDPNFRNFEIKLDLNVYDHFIIELSLIHSFQLSASSTLITRRYKWPRTCLEIPHTDSTCALPIYGPPVNLTMYHETLTKLPSFHATLPNILHVKWSYAYQPEFPPPSVYYIEVFDTARIFDDRYYSYFVTTNTKSVAILHDSLNNSFTFYVSVRPYIRCSGLANRTYALGCGGLAISRSTPLPGVPPVVGTSAGMYRLTACYNSIYLGWYVYYTWYYSVHVVHGLYVAVAGKKRTLA